MSHYKITKYHLVLLSVFCISSCAMIVEDEKTNKNMILNDIELIDPNFSQIETLLYVDITSQRMVHIKNGTEVTGFCFTPQDGNSLLSSISIAEWFMYPNSYEEKIQ